MKEIFLAGGCFWGVQRYYDQIAGVIGTQVGYANGRTVGPTYEDVCRGDSDFAETVWVRYDENKISLEDILTLFFRIIDPTARDRQGNDVPCGRIQNTELYCGDTAELSPKDRHGDRTPQELLYRRSISPALSGKEPGRILPHQKGGFSICRDVYTGISGRITIR